MVCIEFLSPCTDERVTEVIKYTDDAPSPSMTNAYAQNDDDPMMACVTALLPHEKLKRRRGKDWCSGYSARLICFNQRMTGAAERQTFNCYLCIPWRKSTLWIMHDAWTAQMFSRNICAIYRFFAGTPSATPRLIRVPRVRGGNQ